MTALTDPFGRPFTSRQMISMGQQKVHQIANFDWLAVLSYDI